MVRVSIREEGDWEFDTKAARDAALEEGKASIEENIHPNFDAWCPKKTGQMVGSWDVKKRAKSIVMSYNRQSETGYDIAGRCENDPDFAVKAPNTPGTGPRPLGRAFDAGSDQVVEDMAEAYIEEAMK